MNCPGSIDLIRERGRPQEYSDDRLAGTRAHKYAEDYLRYGGIVIDLDGVDEEMIEAAQYYVDDVLSVADLTGADPIIEGELIARPLDKQGRVVGRADCWLFDSKNNVIYVWDFKYGRRPVSAYENWQLIGAAAGALYNTNHRPGCTIEMRIVQPRAPLDDGPISKYTTTKEGLQPLFDKAQEIVNYIFDENILTRDCNTGPHCFNCPVAHTCRALAGSALSIMDFTAENVPNDLSNDQMGWLLRQCELAEKRMQSMLDGLRTEAVYRVSQGGRIPGYHMQRGMSRAKWTVTPEEVVAMGLMFGLDLSVQTVKTPSQAKTAGVPESLVKQASQRYPTEAELKFDGTRYINLKFGD